MNQVQFPIETGRLLIRPFTAADVDALHGIWGNPANERFTPDWPSPRSVAETRALMERMPPWGVWERDTDELVGDCGLFRDGTEWELAYGFRRNRWGLGYATEAARACIEAGFEQLGLHRIVADITDPSNHASIRVLEKLGFRPDGERYALTRS